MKIAFPGTLKGTAGTGLAQQKLRVNVEIEMWEKYLDNIAAWWRQNYHASVEEKPTPIVESTDLQFNPYLRELPGYLQKSQYYYDYNPF